jgi:hypothetical protein
VALFHSPSIVTSGLVLCLDAGNTKSYPGSGTTWTDLSGNGKNGTLVNGVGYSGNNLGSLSFDGVNDVISLGTGNTFFPLPNFTIELWFSSDGTTPTTGTLPGLLGLTYGIRLLVYSNSLSYSLDNGSSFTSITSPSSYNFYNSSWHYVAIQANSTTRYLYINGDLINTLLDSWSGTTQWPTNDAYIGRDNNDSMYFFRGKIASIKFYNRVLTSQEIRQNYNALKGRFGLT